MKGPRAQAILEQDGYTITVDPDHERGYAVTNGKGVFVGRYDLDDSDHWRFGWVVTPNGRRDCLSFMEFELEIVAVF